MNYPSVTSWDEDFKEELDTTNFDSKTEWLRWFSNNHLDNYIEATKPLNQLGTMSADRRELYTRDITKFYYQKNYNLRKWLMNTNTEGRFCEIEDFEYEKGLKPIYGMCHMNVEIAVELFGGKRISCYQIQRFRKTCYIKLFHSAWEDKDGCIRDITPNHPKELPNLRRRLIGLQKGLELNIIGNNVEVTGTYTPFPAFTPVQAFISLELMLFLLHIKTELN